MKKETLKRIFDFLENKENKKNIKKGTLMWKLFFNEPLTKDDLIVKGDLDLSYSKITSLPEGLEVGGSLDLSNCTSLTSLPKGLKVGKNLDLENCKSLTSLPEGLEVGKNLYFENTPLEQFLDSVLLNMIGSDGYIKGNISRL